MRKILLLAIATTLLFTMAAASQDNQNEGENMIKGLRTVTYPVPDLEEGKEWYTRILGVPPYFDEPFYVGYEVGGFELGLMPGGDPGHQGAVAYWGVASAEGAFERLLELGAKPNEPIAEVGGGIKVATVVDPFGNVFGIIENPLFDREAVR